MLLVIDLIFGFLSMFGIGLLAGMPLPQALLFMIIVQAICMGVGAILGAWWGAFEGMGLMGLILHIIVLVICSVSFFIKPDKADRYIPDVAISASYDAREGINLRDIDAEESFYLQIRGAVQSNSWARNLFFKNEIDIIMEISNPDNSVFSEAQNIQYFKEKKPPKIEADKITYFYTVRAARKPKMAVIDFKVTPTKTGSQSINISYDRKVSDIHAKVVTLEYK